MLSPRPAAKKAKKDPNAPKRARSAYIYFSTEKRPEFSGKTFADATRKVSELWNAMSDAQKKKWTDLAAKDQERYKKEKAAYEKK